ncbi:MAG: hypothetical protein NTW12_00525 [Deltaproteobacteria bacterium]|nr:hypothetical protein [Deltaproteobacteria bacterium]
MSFKKMKTNFTFTDISLFSSMEKNRAIKRMEQINAIVDWARIEGFLMGEIGDIHDKKCQEENGDFP